MEELMHLCQQYDVPVIEDAAESLGTMYKGKASGTIGKFGIYSFNGNKIITTSGGGMLVSNDKAAMKQARFLATQARDPAAHYQHSQMGYNYRLSNLLAGVGRAQLQVLDKRVNARRAVFDLYEQQLAFLPGIRFMKELKDTKTNRWLTVFTIDPSETHVTVDHLLHALQLENIEARKVWKPLHMQPLFTEAMYYPHHDQEHVAEQLFSNGICLPSGSAMRVKDQLRVITCITKCFDTIMGGHYFIPGKQEV
ncbi:8-amino-3,8-dideoxy-alpha-D-manno-octulosonate transaminase [Lentibacillus sp. JNUCC-1]|nr:8-amino-3,8-dideoxy-alpha-D-manno-octulosonate transaminase [Lentibacillus sp. JNUCC-1]